MPDRYRQACASFSLAAEADRRYDAAATKLTAARVKSAEKLNKAVNAELTPLKLERAKFSTQIDSDSTSPGPQGFDRVEFWVQTNPGTRPGPLMKVASGGELSRFLLALKVVLGPEVTEAQRAEWEARHHTVWAAAETYGDQLRVLMSVRDGLDEELIGESLRRKRARRLPQSPAVTECW